jgi:UDPglucose 6-dehydrogenase
MKQVEYIYEMNITVILKDSDALVLLTEWKEFRSPDFEEIKTQLKTPCYF